MSTIKPDTLCYVKASSFRAGDIVTAVRYAGVQPVMRTSTGVITNQRVWEVDPPRFSPAMRRTQDVLAEHVLVPLNDPDADISIDDLVVQPEETTA
jgi:hypothetical protein